MRDDISDVKSTMDIKSTKYKKPRENLCNKKKLAVLLMNQRLLFKLRHLTY